MDQRQYGVKQQPGWQQPHGYAPQGAPVQGQAGAPPWQQPQASQQAQQGQQPYAQQPLDPRQFDPQYQQYLRAQRMQAANGVAYGMQQQFQSQPQKRRRGPFFWIAIIVALLAIAVIIWLVISSFGGGLVRDPNQASGQLEGKTPEEIQAELERVVDEGMFNISIASIIEFPDGTSPGEIRIENVPGNRYLMQVTITDDATGQTLFTSGVIEPDHHIQTAPLDVDLDAGQYACTATFSALDPNDETEIGQAAAKVTINVLA